MSQGANQNPNRRVRVTQPVISGYEDPSSVATLGLQGQLYLQIGTSNVWQKQDNGRTTNWILFGAGGGAGVNFQKAVWADSNNPNPGDGSSADPFQSLQDALDYIALNGALVDIWSVIIAPASTFLENLVFPGNRQIALYAMGQVSIGSGGSPSAMTLDTTAGTGAIYFCGVDTGKTSLFGISGTLTISGPSLGFVTHANCGGTAYNIDSTGAASCILQFDESQVNTVLGSATLWESNDSLFNGACSFGACENIINCNLNGGFTAASISRVIGSRVRGNIAITAITTSGGFIDCTFPTFTWAGPATFMVDKTGQYDIETVQAGVLPVGTVVIENDTEGGLNFERAIYVDSNNAVAGDGTSANPYQDLQDALNDLGTNFNDTDRPLIFVGPNSTLAGPWAVPADRNVEIVAMGALSLTGTFTIADPTIGQNYVFSIRPMSNYNDTLGAQAQISHTGSIVATGALGNIELQLQGIQAFSGGGIDFSGRTGLSRIYLFNCLFSGTYIINAPTGDLWQVKDSSLQLITIDAATYRDMDHSYFLGCSFTIAGVSDELTGFYDSSLVGGTVWNGATEMRLDKVTQYLSVSNGFVLPATYTIIESGISPGNPNSIRFNDATTGELTESLDFLFESGTANLLFSATNSLGNGLRVVGHGTNITIGGSAINLYILSDQGGSFDNMTNTIIVGSMNNPGDSVGFANNSILLINGLTTSIGFGTFEKNYAIISGTPNAIDSASNSFLTYEDCTQSGGMFNSFVSLTGGGQFNGDVYSSIILQQGGTTTDVFPSQSLLVGGNLTGNSAIILNTVLFANGMNSLSLGAAQTIRESFVAASGNLNGSITYGVVASDASDLYDIVGSVISGSILSSTGGSITNSVLIGSSISIDGLTTTAVFGESHATLLLNYSLVYGLGHTTGGNPFNGVFLGGSSQTATRDNQMLIGESAVGDAQTMFAIGAAGTNVIRVSDDGLVETDQGGKRVKVRDDAGSPVTVDPRTDYVVNCSNGGAVAVNLPAGVAGMEYKIHVSGGTVATVTPNGGDTIEGAATLPLATGGITIVFNPVTLDWMVF